MSKYRVILDSRNIVSHWWGEQWCQNLELYADFSNRLERGRAYLRAGNVHELTVEQGVIQTCVDGHSEEPYQVEITFDPLPSAKMEQLQGAIEVMSRSPQEGVPDQYRSLFSLGNEGIFPRIKEIHYRCSCKDHFTLCKHVAATLFAFGSVLDSEPLELIKIRGLDIDSLLCANIRRETNMLLVRAQEGQGSDRIIEDAQIADMFGLVFEDLPGEGAKASADKSPDETTEGVQVIKVTGGRSQTDLTSSMSSRMLICQYRLTGGLVDCYENFDEAELSARIPRKVIQLSISGELSSGGGFLWREFPANNVPQKIDGLVTDERQTAKEKTKQPHSFTTPPNTLVKKPKQNPLEELKQAHEHFLPYESFYKQYNNALKKTGTRWNFWRILLAIILVPIILAVSAFLFAGLFVTVFPEGDLWIPFFVFPLVLFCLLAIWIAKAKDNSQTSKLRDLEEAGGTISAAYAECSECPIPLAYSDPKIIEKLMEYVGNGKAKSVAGAMQAFNRECHIKPAEIPFLIPRSCIPRGKKS